MNTQSEKYKNTCKVIKISLMVISIICMPLVIAAATSIWENPIINNLETSNDWIGFFGSYIGSLLGGIITLIVMYNTIKSGEQNLNKSIEENIKLHNDSKCNEFCNQIVDLIGQYCSDISMYFYKCIAAESYDLNVRHTREMYRNGEINESQYNSMMDNLNNNRPHADRSKSVEIYFKLGILLKDIDNSKDILDTLERLHDTYIYISQYNQGGEANFNSDIDKLVNQTRTFINNYKSNNKLLT